MPEKTPLVVAHRGGPGLGQYENTMAAFESAIHFGCAMFETDIRRSRDGHLVCHHDADIEGVKLADMSLLEMLRLAEKQGYTIPVFRDVLQQCQGRIKFDIELKEVGYELQVVELVRDFLPREDYVIKSFHDSTVTNVKIIDPQITAGLLVAHHPYDNRLKDLASQLTFEARLLACRADFLSPETTMVNKLLVQRAKILGRQVYVWTVNDADDMRRLAQLGVDAIITDKPDLAKTVFAAN